MKKQLLILLELVPATLVLGCESGDLVFIGMAGSLSF